jgi:hypothetical protein
MSEFPDAVSPASARASKIFGLALAVLIFGVPLAWFFRGPPSYWRSYVGRTEPEVVAALGPPRYNERTVHPDYVPGEPYLAWWPYSFGGRLCIDFDGSGRAVAQYRNDK